MTFEGTKVDIDELRSFGKGAEKRSRDTDAAAEMVGEAHMRFSMFGLICNSFLDEATAGQQKVLSTLRSAAEALSEDGAVATTNADEFDDTNTAQASRFTSAEMELP